MMAVIAIQPLQPQTVQLCPEPEQSETVEATSGIFDNVKESLIYWWSLFMGAAHLALANTGFFLFRALEFISPTWALRAEGIVLRISNAWQAMQQERAIGNLLEKNAELEWQKQRLERKSEDRDQLAVECTALREQNRYLHGLQQGAEGVNQHQAQQVQATGQQRDLLYDENARLRLQVEQLGRQLQESKDQVDPLNTLVLQLRAQLQDARRTAQDYELQAQPRQAFYQQVEQIAHNCRQVHVRQPTELDRNLEELLPLLLGQLGQAQQLLGDVKEDLPEDGSAMIAVRSFERILGQMHQSLSNIPVAFKRHTAWQTHIHQIVEHLPRMQEVY